MATLKPVVPCGKVLPTVLADPRMTEPGRRRIVFRLPLRFSRVHSSCSRAGRDRRSWVGGLRGGGRKAGLGLKLNRNEPLHWAR